MNKYQMTCLNCDNTFFGKPHETICFWCRDEIFKSENPELHKLWWEALEHQYQRLLNPEKEFNEWYNPELL